MAFNINAFRSNGPTEGGARPSLFEVQISLPTGLGADPNTEKKITFLARSTHIPASIIGTVDVPYMGRKIKVNGDRDFQDWSVTIINDEDFSIRDAMERWSNKMNTHISNRLDSGMTSITPGSGSYKAIADVKQYAKAGPNSAAGVIRRYQFNGVFPTVISEINLDWEATNQIEMFQVTFAYDYWTPMGTGITTDDFGILQPDNVT